jgi:hypothetical protein
MKYRKGVHGRDVFAVQLIPRHVQEVQTHFTVGHVHVSIIRVGLGYAATVSTEQGLIR